MGLNEKFDNALRQFRGRVVRKSGEAVDNPRLAAEGRSEERRANMRQTGEKIKDAFRGRGRRRY
jgi:uncharacterized protein YjbJ (UPF0337 family)